jgi:hypothetical protein
MNNALAIALKKIGMCLDYQALYSMEPDFNEIGLTVQTTPQNRMILCKIHDNKPLAESIIDDYIFIGSLDTATNEISERATEKIKEFVKEAAGEKSEIKNIARPWRDGLRMYGKAVRLEEGTYSDKNPINESSNYPVIES